MSLDLLKVIFISSTGIINIFLAFLVLIRNPKNIINQIFFSISFLLGIWSFCLLFYEFPPIFSRIFWIKATYLIVSLQEVLVLAFSFNFPRPVFKKLWIFGFLYSTFFLGSTIYLLFFTNSWIEDVVIDPAHGLQTILGAGYTFWSFTVWGVLIFAIVNFILNMRRSRGNDRSQILYLFIGFSLYGIIATVADIIFPFVYKDTSLFSISTVASLAFTATASYVIIKHGFLDIRLVVARSVAYICLVLILGVFYIAGLFFITTNFIKQESSLSNLLISTVLALFMVFTFQPLKTFLERFTDRIFFKGRYDSNQLFSELGNIMSSHIELNDLSSRILNALTSEMRISRAALVLLEKESVYGISAVNFSHPPSYDYPKLIQIMVPHQPIVFDELAEGELKQLMRVLNVSVSATLRVKEDLVGVFLLGEKASGETYSGEDLKVLNILMPEVAIAIANAKAVDKIKKFNVTLVQEVQKATAELRAANEKLKELDKLKDDFVSIASHELRTPMTAIKSYLWMAIYRPDMKLSEKMNKYISRAYLSTERLINLVNDMLNVSRIESGSIEVRPKVFDMPSLVDEVVGEATAKAAEKMIQLHVVKSAVPQIFADPDKVHQVLLNLVGNALKFVPTDGQISVSFFTDGQVLETSVKDNGVGISKEDLSKLFQKFGRLDNSYVAAATTGGTGLGLFISKNLVELMGGKIWAASEGLGKGTTFTFSLPLASKEILARAEQFTKRPAGEIKGLESVAI